MRCTEARPLFSSYLDRAVSGTEMHEIFAHLEQCAGCQKEYVLLENTRSLVSSLGRRQPPSDLALKIRVAISSTRSRNSLSLFQRCVLRLENTFQGFMVPATAGVLSAVIFFGSLMVLLVPAQVSANDDVPSTFYTPPRLQVSEYPENQLSLDSPVVIETYVDTSGPCGEFPYYFRARRRRSKSAIKPRSTVYDFRSGAVLWQACSREGDHVLFPYKREGMRLFACPEGSDPQGLTLSVFLA